MALPNVDKLSGMLAGMGITPQAAMNMARAAAMNEQISKGPPEAFANECRKQSMADAAIETTWKFAMECARDRRD